MAIDRTESVRRAQPRRKTATVHPYAAIDHRVIDSAAFADLKPNSVRLLLLMARQLTKGNNGRLQASFKWCRQRGIGSEHTLRNAIAELISHGFIYRTRSHGANGAWAKYAVTWLSLTDDRNGLFCDGFVFCAWRYWEDPGEKTSRQFLLDRPRRNCRFTSENPAETAGITPVETADYELVPCSAMNLKQTYSAIPLVHVPSAPTSYGAWAMHSSSEKLNTCGLVATY